MHTDIVVVLLHYCLDIVSVPVSQYIEQVGFLAMHRIGDVAEGLVATEHCDLLA